MTRYTILAGLLFACGSSSNAGPAPSASRTTQETEASNNRRASATAARSVEREMRDARLTTAPQRLKVAAVFDAPLDEVWGYLSNHDNLVEYSGGILQSADIDRTGSGGTDGVGATRECRVGSDRFVERIVFYEAPYAFAYSAYENTWGMEDHLAAVLLIPEGNRTRIEWSVYFNTADPAATSMMTQNMQGMMRGPMMGFLTQRFGGELLPPEA